MMVTAANSIATATATVRAVLLSVMLTAGGLAGTQPAVDLAYPDLVREVRRLEPLEGSEYRLSNEVLDQRVRLDVKRFGADRNGGGSDDEDRAAFYVQLDDGLVFTCVPAPVNFRSGVLEARVVRHDPGAASRHFFTLSDCTPAK